MSWLRRARKGISLLKQGENGKAPATKLEIPDNLWTKCPSCGDLIYHKELAGNLWVCYQCDYHFPIGTHQYLDLLLDENSFVETHRGLVSVDPLNFKDSKRYKDRIKDTRQKTGREDAVITGFGNIEGVHITLAVMDFSFMAGSMGSVVGEKISRAIKDALDQSLPLLIVSRSGGARMQESILSLMQMAKTSAMLARLSEEKIPFISLLTHPTTGGVTASFAMLGDVILAEPKALIGFAGPRVIKQTIHTDLPEGFQMSEFLMEHGMVDRIVSRKNLRGELLGLLRFLHKDASVGEAPVQDESGQRLSAG
jgi:acetyl-CoA carboxylase carboxyl transferase subunit beta